MSVQSPVCSSAPKPRIADLCLCCDTKVDRTTMLIGNQLTYVDNRYCDVVCSCCFHRIRKLPKDVIEASRDAPRLPGDNFVNLWEVATHIDHWMKTHFNID